MQEENLHRLNNVCSLFPVPTRKPTDVQEENDSPLQRSEEAWRPSGVLQDQQKLISYLNTLMGKIIYNDVVNIYHRTEFVFFVLFVGMSTCLCIYDGV